MTAAMKILWVGGPEVPRSAFKVSNAASSNRLI